MNSTISVLIKINVKPNVIESAPLQNICIWLDMIETIFQWENFEYGFQLHSVHLDVMDISIDRVFCSRIEQNDFFFLHISK